MVRRPGPPADIGYDVVLGGRGSAHQLNEPDSSPVLQDALQVRVHGHHAALLGLQRPPAVLGPDLKRPKWGGGLVEVAPTTPAGLALAHAAEQAKGQEHADRLRDLVVRNEHRCLGTRVGLAFLRVFVRKVAAGQHARIGRHEFGDLRVAEHRVQRAVRVLKRLQLHLAGNLELLERGHDVTRPHFLDLEAGELWQREKAAEVAAIVGCRDVAARGAPRGAVLSNGRLGRLLVRAKRALLHLALALLVEALGFALVGSGALIVRSALEPGDDVISRHVLPLLGDYSHQLAFFFARCCSKYDFKSLT